MADFIIRKIIKEDIRAWAMMRELLWPSASLEEHLAEANEFFRLDSFRAWVAIKDENYIGFAEASLRPYANGCKSRPVVFFEGIWVDLEHRKRGVGKAFVQMLENWASSQGIMEIGSDSELANILSQTCHQKWGFEESERVIYYRKSLSVP